MCYFMFLLYRGVAQLGQSAAFGTQRSQVQILSPRLIQPLFAQSAQFRQRGNIRTIQELRIEAVPAYNIVHKLSIYHFSDSALCIASTDDR